jgi:hypothetical protein
MNEGVLHRCDDRRRGRSHQRLTGGEETIQANYLWLRRHNDALVTRTHLRPLPTFGDCRGGHGDGLDGGEVEQEVGRAFGATKISPT